MKAWLWISVIVLAVIAAVLFWPFLFVSLRSMLFRTCAPTSELIPAIVSMGIVDQDQPKRPLCGTPDAERQLRQHQIFRTLIEMQSELQNPKTPDSRRAQLERLIASYGRWLEDRVY